MGNDETFSHLDDQKSKSRENSMYQITQKLKAHLDDQKDQKRMEGGLRVGNETGVFKTGGQREGGSETAEAERTSSTVTPAPVKKALRAEELFLCRYWYEPHLSDSFVFSDPSNYEIRELQRRYINRGRRITMNYLKAEASPLDYESLCFGASQ